MKDLIKNEIEAVVGGGYIHKLAGWTGLFISIKISEAIINKYKDSLSEAEKFICAYFSFIAVRSVGYVTELGAHQLFTTLQLYLRNRHFSAKEQHPHKL